MTCVRPNREGSLPVDEVAEGEGNRALLQPVADLGEARLGAGFVLVASVAATTAAVGAST